uniref:Uncharacterized protein n=1 Tax=viral metagenome TaxID=1070528 RepID=A0A6C0DXC2_9ZZZZ
MCKGVKHPFYMITNLYVIILSHFFSDQKNMYPRKTKYEKSRRIIYEFSYKWAF